MPTSASPHVHANEAREALRSLAHATRCLNDPTETYAILGELTNGLASLAQSLQQLGASHDHHNTDTVWVEGDVHAGRAASYRVAWELHRAAEMLHQVAECVDRAHEVEATITYTSGPPDRPNRRPSPNAGLSL